MTGDIFSYGGKNRNTFNHICRQHGLKFQKSSVFDYLCHCCFHWWRKKNLLSPTQFKCMLYKYSHFIHFRWLQTDSCSSFQRELIKELLWSWKSGKAFLYSRRKLIRNQIPLFNQDDWGAGSVPVPTLEPVLCVLESGSFAGLEKKNLFSLGSGLLWPRINYNCLWPPF